MFFRIFCILPALSFVSGSNIRTHELSATSTTKSIHEEYQEANEARKLKKKKKSKASKASKASKKSSKSSNYQASGNYKFDYYPIEENRNCLQESTLSLLFKSSKKDKYPENEDGEENSQCCAFQDEVVMDIEEDAAEDDAYGLNLIHVYMGQIIMSHDTAETHRSKTEKITLTCEDKRQFVFGALEESKGDFANEETACIDGSPVYSSLWKSTRELTRDTYPKLREGLEAMLDECPVPMDNPLGRGKNKMFALGDTRGNENPALNSLHLMWAKRHNQWVDYYSPLLSDKELFEKARARTIAEIQLVSKLYVEALIGKPLPYHQKYAEHGEEVQLFAEFSHSINRVQHAQIKAHIPIQYANGNTDEVALGEALFNPELINTYGGISNIIRGSAYTASSTIGLHFVRELIGNIGTTGGPNLAIIDCHRGREIGLASYNTVRDKELDDEVKGFSDIHSDSAVQQKLNRIYNDDHENIDLFVGGLAEEHENGSSVGKTFEYILTKQMEEFMYHDEGWFENTSNNGPLSAAELNEVKATTLADILLQTTDIGCVPKDAFRIPSAQNPIVCTDEIDSPFTSVA